MPKQNVKFLKTFSVGLKETHPLREHYQIPLPIQEITQLTEIITEPESDITESEIENMTEHDPHTLERMLLKFEEEKKDRKATAGFSIPYSLEIRQNFQVMSTIVAATADEVKAKLIVLPPKGLEGKLTKKTLLLDLDETLIHTINPKNNYNLINVKQENCKTLFLKDPSNTMVCSIKVSIRPYAMKLLQEMSSIYEVVVS